MPKKFDKSAENRKYLSVSERVAIHKQKSSDLNLEQEEREWHRKWLRLLSKQRD